MSKAEELIEKYNLGANTYYSPESKPYQDEQKRQKQIIDAFEGKGFPPEHLFYTPEYLAIKNKWQSYVKDKWYGFGGLGEPIPVIWYAVIGEFLDWVKEECPEFKILQLKIRFGKFVAYFEDINDKVQEEIDKLGAVMFDNKLVY